MVWSPRAGHGAVETYRRHPVAYALPLDSSSDVFCEFILSALKNFGGPGAQLHEIVPAQFQPRIHLLQFHQDNFGYTLARDFEGAADLRFVPAPHPRDLALSELVKVDKFQHENCILILLREGALNRLAEQIQQGLFARRLFRLRSAVEKI